MPRGTLTEIFGPASSGRTALLLSALAAATRRQEVCALVDAGDSLHPESAAAAGIDLQRLLWIRCGSYSPPRHRDTEEIDDLTIDDCRLQNHKPTTPLRINTDVHGFNRQSKIVNRQFREWDSRLTQVLKATDLLLQSSGFGMVVVDLADVPPHFARRIPLASWFRFRRAVENTPTVLLVAEQEPYAKTCASLALQMQPSELVQRSKFVRQHSAISSQQSAVHFSVARMNSVSRNAPAHAQLLRTLPARAEIVHDRFQRKPARSVSAEFAARTEWTRPVAG